MIPTRTYHYRDPAAAAIGLRELRKQGLTTRGILFIALDPRGETYICTPEDLDAVTKVRVGDKMGLEPPWDGRYFHFDAIHRLPGDTVLWNGDRRLDDTGSASEVATAVAAWLKGSSAKNMFLGCTPHQPGSWWTVDERSPVTELHQQGIVDCVVTASGILARKTGEPDLFHLTFEQLATGGPAAGWTPVFRSTFGNVLLIERRVINYRLVLTCERGLIELDVSGLPEEVTVCGHAGAPSGVGVVGRIDGGPFAVTRGRAEPWGLADVAPATLINSPNQSVIDIGNAVADDDS
jgi:hypothetical protein